MSTENTPIPETTETEPVAPETAAPTEGTETPAEAAPTETAEPETAEAKAEAEEAKHKRAGGWQRKIERQERELAELRAKLAGQPTQPAAPTKTKTADEQAAEYVEALVAKQLAEREAQRQQQAAQAAFAARTQEVRAAHPDFDDVIASADAPVSQAVQEAILTSEHGPRIMYQLATNPAELARISALPPLAAAREIGRLEAKLASVTAAPKTSPSPASRKPAVPAPITPVTSRGPSTVKRPEDMSYEEYTIWRNGQTKR